MSPRGEVALIVALIGLQMNAISQRAYGIVVFMTAVTTLVPPFFIKKLFRQTEPLEPLTLQEETEEIERAENVPGTMG